VEPIVYKSLLEIEMREETCSSSLSQHWGTSRKPSSLLEISPVAGANSCRISASVVVLTQGGAEEDRASDSSLKPEPISDSSDILFPDL